MTISKEKSNNSWVVILFIFIGGPLGFAFGGVFVGLAMLVVGVVALGWDKRHDGPFPTNKP